MRSNRLFLLVLGMAALTAFAAACGTPATPAATPVAATPTALQLPTSAAPQQPAATTGAAGGPSGSSDELSGESLYMVSCAACHGQDRGGSTFDMDGQKIEVPALGWDDLSSTYQEQPSRGTVAEQLALAITKGQSETGEDLEPMMPRWSSLSQAQVDSLIQYLQSPGASAGGVPTLTAAATSLTGQGLYEASCAACHGADGAGKTFESEGNKITTPSLGWGELSQMYSTDPSRGDVKQQVALAITKGQDEAGDDMNPMMPRWTFLSQAQVDSLVQYLEATFK